MFIFWGLAHRFCAPFERRDLLSGSRRVALVLIMSIGVGFLATLAAAEPAAQPARLDRYGDPMPEGAIARLGTIRLRHTDYLADVVYCPDGKTVASIGDYSLYGDTTPASTSRHVIHFWDPVSGKEQRRLTGHQKRITALAVSPNGKYVASADESTLCLWDFESGRRLHEVQPPRANKFGQGIVRLAFMPDSKAVVAICGEGIVRIWDVDGTEKLSFASYPYSPSNLTWGCTLAVSPDGETLAFLTPGGAKGNADVRLFDAITGKERRHWNAHVGMAQGLVFTPDGKTVVSGGGDGTIRFWDAATGRQLRQIRVASLDLYKITLSADGQVLAGCGCGPEAVVLWEASTGKELRRLRGHRTCHGNASYAVTCFAFSADGKRLATGGQDNSVRFWDAATGAEVSGGGSLGCYSRGLAFTPDGATVITNGFFGTLHLWSAASGAEIRQCQTEDALITGFAVAPDGRTAAAGLTHNRDKFVPRVVFWDLASGRQLPQVLTTQSPIGSLAYAANGRMLVVGGWKKNSLWDLGMAREAAVFTPRDQKPGATYMGWALSPDGSTLVCAARDTYDLYDAVSGKELRRLPREPGAVPCFVVAPGGNILAFAGKEHTVWLYDLTVGKNLCRMVGHQGDIECLAFAPDGKELVSGGRDGTARLWETASGQEIRCFRGHVGSVYGVAFAPDGRLFASASGDTTVMVWDRTGRLRDRQLAHVDLSAQDRNDLWKALASADAGAAQRAVWTWVAGGDASVAELKRRLTEDHGSDGRRIVPLLADLASDQFAVRQKATEELEKLGDLALPALRRYLADHPPLEVHQRLQRLLEKQAGTAPSAGRLRVLRATQALEQIGSPAARQALEGLVTDGPATWLIQEARAARERLARHAAP